jgi:hypothetical protein
MVMLAMQTQSVHHGREITWIANGKTIVGHFDNMRLCIEKLPNRGQPLSDNLSVVRLLPQQYKTTVDGVIANPKCPIRNSLHLAKEDAVAFAIELPSRIDARREARKAELLSKLSLPDAD